MAPLEDPFALGPAREQRELVRRDRERTNGKGPFHQFDRVIRQPGVADDPAGHQIHRFPGGFDRSRRVEIVDLHNVDASQAEALEARPHIVADTRR